MTEKELEEVGSNGSSNPKYNEQVSPKPSGGGVEAQKEPTAEDMAHHHKMGDEEEEQNNQKPPTLTLSSNLTLLFSTTHWVIYILLIACGIGFHVMVDKLGGLNGDKLWNVGSAHKALYITGIIFYWIGAITGLFSGFIACFAGGNAMKNWGKKTHHWRIHCINSHQFSE
mmetsp:Transcript_12210/g.18196  ORF Transcript_12210/g.18196 Transcript_12210/m.18196 type:complete len:170 (+) Transcript_12210:92-601(+)